MESLNMDRGAPILIRIYKEENTLEVWKQDRTGKFACSNPIPICKFSGNLGPKIVQGDHQAPEGFYDITPEQMNPNSVNTLPLILVFPMRLIDLLAELAVFLWCMAAADQLAAMR
jgi:murein L,D-transpeptidase YafK